MFSEDEILFRIQIPTKDLKAEIIQELLIIAKKNLRSSAINKGQWNQVAETLWLHLHSGFEKFDDQLICATCFYSILMLTNNDDNSLLFITKVKQIIDEQIESKESFMENSKLSLATSLMYGLFQSSFLTCDGVSDVPGLIPLLQSIVRLLSIMAYQYSRYTFMAFKTISAFRKLIGKELQHNVFDKENKIILLNLVNHNWENPVTGIRDLNKDIFRMLVLVLDEDLYTDVLEEINGFYWNKAKYLMLAEIIDQSNVELSRLYRDDWLDGLANSLYKSGLVSAGADMYYAILKKLKSHDEWCTIFLDKITEILGGNSNKPIENFYNYWCLPTLKKFNTLMNNILDKLQHANSDEQKLFSELYLIKQANRLGLVNKSWNSIETLSKVESKVLLGTENSHNHVRMLAFEILCVSQTKNMPTRMEYMMVLDYIQANINSDCTVLRLSMLNSIGTFLTHIHITYLNTKNICYADMENLREFCEDFQELLIDSLTMRGNYQRKITSIKLIKVFFCTLNEVPRKRQKQIRQSAITLIEFLNINKQWILLQPNIVKELLSHLNDPAEDIRDNVTELLLNHYNKELQNPKVLNSIIENALESMKCKFFHEINCGQSMFELLTSLLIKEKSTAKFKSVEDIFQYAYAELMSEFKLKRSIVDSIDKGKQLYSFMSILRVVLEVCKQKKYVIDILKFDLIEFIRILNNISNQFALENETTTSSDFSEMSDMVEHIIANSECGQHTQIYGAQISNLHQLVLNCLWLNVKGSCDLSSLFILFLEKDSETDICEKCLYLITHVLETCRHKGAIEAAGSALGQAIRHLTSLPENSELSKLPYSLLEHKLKELIYEAGKMASVTRRGAGLSIMVHRIVSSDMRKEKPLFHYFMKILLDVCKKTEDCPSISDEDDEKDLPKAIYIHFLTRIVLDSSLASDMMFYSAKLAELAFENLTSPYWQIRNAALQLYGALIPKLIGQKKASGADDETIATVACDELRTHSPQLWKFIVEQIKKKSYDDKLQYHSNLVPILNMLANAAMRYNFSFDVADSFDLLESLLALLDSPIYTVRRLTAKCIYNLYTYNTVLENLVHVEILSENFCHGCLLLTWNYFNRYKRGVIGEREIDEKLECLNEKFSMILVNQDHSYPMKLVYEKIFGISKLDLDTLNTSLIEMRTKKHSPGVFLWANERIEQILMNLPLNELPNVVEIVLSYQGIEDFHKTLLTRIENEKDIPNDIIKDIAKTLLQHQHLTSDVWELLYKIALKTNIDELVNIKRYLEHWKINGVSYRQRYLLPLVAKISVSLLECYEEIPQIILNMTNPESDVDMRYIAAIANNELGKKIMDLPATVKIVLIKSTLILLQDEDEDVRNEAAKFYRTFAGVERSVHPFLCLKKILNYEFLSKIFDENEISGLQQDLAKMFLKNVTKCSSVDQYNPFANDSKNIYFEVELYSRLIAKLKR